MRSAPVAGKKLHKSDIFKHNRVEQVRSLPQKELLDSITEEAL